MQITVKKSTKTIDHLLKDSCKLEKALRKVEKDGTLDSYGTMLSKRLTLNFKYWIALTSTDKEVFEESIIFEDYEDDLLFYVGATLMYIDGDKFERYIGVQEIAYDDHMDHLNGNGKTMLVEAREFLKSLSKKDLAIEAKRFIMDNLESVEIENEELEELL